jgi:3-oxoacyl-(acyl-carrier-protein) synthase
MHGHTLGAAGAIEAVATVLALERGEIPPTVHCDAPDPECNLNVVTGQARPARIGIALSNTFAFGGLNASLVLARAP